MGREVRSLSIVVPTYNERENLPRLLEGIARHAPRDYEVIVVDDGSPDGTADAARALGDAHPLRVVERGGKRGLGSAYREGFRVASGDAIFEMDADLSHDPRFIPALVEAVQGGAALAVGSRRVEEGGVDGWGVHRKVVSAGANLLARTLLGLPVRDATSGFRCYAAEARDVVLRTRADGYAFQVESLYLARQWGLPVTEVPIRFEDRRHGESKLGVADVGAFLATCLSLRFKGASAPPAGGERGEAVGPDLAK